MFFSIEAQQYFFKNYSVESGLPFTGVSCMYQDANGYLWSGGHGGLSRFDGKQFLNFNRKNGLVDHNVNAICGDSAGAIFIGTNKGLSILRGKQFKNYTNFNGINHPSVTSFCKGHHNSMYIGTGSGLFMFKEHDVNPIKKLDGYKINCLYNPDTNVIFVGTDKGLILYGHSTFKILNKANGLAANNVNCVTKFKNFLIIGTSEGLSLYNFQTKKITNYFIENGLIDENITSLVQQNNQYVWLGSHTGLLRFDGNQFEYYNIEFDNNSNNIICLLLDKENNLWNGTHSGLFRYRDNAFSTFDKISGLGTAFIYQIFRDKTGEIWVTSDNNGVFRQSRNFFKRYGTHDGLGTSSCKSAIQDSDGRLLFGTSIGLSQFKNERFTSIPLPIDFKCPIEVIYQAFDKTIWLGGTNGFVALKFENNKVFTKFYRSSSKADIGVYGFCEDDKHNLYIGTLRGGLLQLVGDSLVNLSNKFNLNEETFFTLKYASGYIFAASLNGVLVFNISTNTIKKINDEDGLNSELVYSIELSEHNSALWIGTNQGINKLDLKKYLTKGEIEISSFGKQEGFAGVECNSNGIWEDSDGTLWFGTVSGLIKYQPFNFKKNVVENNTIIQKISILNEDTVLENHCVLPSDYNTITFYYRGICLTNPDRVLYQKKLEGLAQDKDWSKPSSEDYSKYANLAPGKYIFKIRSCNNEGVWNKNETVFSFEIKPPFYLTWWFLLLTLIVIVSIIYTIFKIRIYNIKKKQRLDFERKVEMSRIELKALRSQMNPHFIFNSLNSIQHYIFHSKSDEAIKYLSKFARLVRIILNNSEKPTVTVGEDLEALKLYLELEQMRFEEKFDYEIIIDESVDSDYDIMPPLLMQPYVENAILHGLNPKPVKGKLTIHLSSKNNFLICTIMDNGIGREKASEIRRTMPFRSHKSLGMKITEDRLKILNEINNSQLSVTITDLKDSDNKPLGTKVELFVPLNG
jgi:ligand-binding sensor domain-containing protein